MIQSKEADGNKWSASYHTASGEILLRDGRGAPHRLCPGEAVGQAAGFGHRDGRHPSPDGSQVRLAALSLLPASALSLLSALGALAGPTIDLRALYGRPLTLAALLGGRPTSGVCGRLMCCLKNEEETYEELNRRLPGIGDSVTTEEGQKGTVQSGTSVRCTGGL